MLEVRELMVAYVCVFPMLDALANFVQLVSSFYNTLDIIILSLCYITFYSYLK